MFARSPFSLPQTLFFRSFRSAICNPERSHWMGVPRITNGGSERAREQTLGEREGRSCQRRISYDVYDCCRLPNLWYHYYGTTTGPSSRSFTRKNGGALQYRSRSRLTRTTWPFSTKRLKTSINAANTSWSAACRATGIMWSRKRAIAPAVSTLSFTLYFIRPLLTHKKPFSLEKTTRFDILRYYRQSFCLFGQ